jgi:hypothetical protein
MNEPEEQPIEDVGPAEQEEETSGLPRGPARGQSATSWYGRSCVKCNQPIHYSYVSEIEGYCGKCTDAVRKQIIETQRADLEKSLIGNKLPENSAGGAGKPILFGVIGVVLGVLAVLAVAVFVPDTWEGLLSAVKGIIGQGGGR